MIDVNHGSSVSSRYLGSYSSVPTIRELYSSWKNDAKRALIEAESVSSDPSESQMPEIDKGEELSLANHASILPVFSPCWNIYVEIDVRIWFL